MKQSVIIVAGGSGTRMQLKLPKQFVEVSGKPIIIHTIEVFLSYNASIDVVLVLPEEHFETWNTIQEDFMPNQKITLAKGGKTRFQSVKAGLDLIQEGLVAIHDAVRPLVTTSVIGDCFDKAEQNGSGVAMVPLKDSIRKKEGDITRAEDRSLFYAVQTPQTFRVDEIKAAFTVEERPEFTDDASVYEHSGRIVNAVEGVYQNLKVTTPEDLILAEALLNIKS